MYEQYKTHPRILELRLVGMHSRFVSEFGYERTASMWQTFCEIGKMNWTIIASVFGRKDVIAELNYTDKKRFRQEMIFMGMLYGETRAKVSQKYLKISKRILYESEDGYADPNVFLNDEWLDKLDYSVAVAGAKAYSLEIERFLSFLEAVRNVVD